MEEGTEQNEGALRSPKHLKRLGTLPCLITKNDIKGGIACNQPAAGHHFTFLFRGKGQKVGDQFTVPLCFAHHAELHRIGEKRFWINHKFTRMELMEIADKLWRKTDGMYN